MDALEQVERTALTTVRRKLYKAIGEKREFMDSNRRRLRVSEILAMNAAIVDWYNAAEAIGLLLDHDEREGII